MTVHNKYFKTAPADAIYIGRGSKWGNPFVIGRDGSRMEVVRDHELKLIEDMKAGTVTLEELAELHGKDLVCFCKPHLCHGDTLEKYAAKAHLFLQQKQSQSN